MTADAVIICLSEQVLKAIFAFMIHTSKVIHVSVLQPPSSSDVVINATSDYLTNEGIIYDTESVLYDEKKLNVRLTFPYYYASTRAY